MTATLYNQSIPPFYLQQRFADAGVGPARKDDIRRLYYLTSHLNTEPSSGAAPIKDWKLKIAAVCLRVPAREACEE